MPDGWFRAVMTAWRVYERAKRHLSQNTVAFRSFKLDIGPGADKRAFLTHRNAVTTRKRVAGMSREVLQADLERKLSMCLHNSFSRNRAESECGSTTLLQTEVAGAEKLGYGRNSVYMLQKFVEGSEKENSNQKRLEPED